MPQSHKKPDSNRGLWLRSKSGPSKPTGDDEPKEKAPLKRYTTDRVYKSVKGPNGEKLYINYISRYNLKWETLHDWLKRRFEGQGLKLEEKAGLDHFHIYLPRMLDAKEKEEIDELRELFYEEPEEYEPDPPLSP